MHLAVAGVDGCKAGWIAVWREAAKAPAVAVFPSFAGLLSALPAETIIAVDMPIGLPDLAAKGGRGPESLVRPLLGERQSCQSLHELGIVRLAIVNIGIRIAFPHRAVAIEAIGDA